ncbi:UPF0755 protein [Stackebrandtia albiflava]|uniref:Endolytic murein transglycosylase n=1 Tax=Stackebrandtia albiflava TaxID=406432 RepID=A0A562VDS3_9ACTN|nr:endolytic transglycosylase MltG [Stackebrandtia albiflava]TWJ16015.1 UPF0755 protein [Stackebrandtia albiflava]
MLDELPFEADDAAKPRSHRRRRRGRSGLTLLLVVVLLGTLGVGGWFGYQKVQDMFGSEDFEGDGNGTEVAVEIPEGALLADIATVLFDEGVVASTGAFIEAAEANSDSKGIQPGIYTLQEEMSGEAAVLALLNPENRETNGFTIPEGLETFTIYERLEEATGIPVEEFEAAAEDPEALGVADFWFTRTDGKEVMKSIEGFLYPETYTFPPNATAAEILSMMVAQFNSVVTEMGFIEKAENDLNISPYEALIVASLAQAEAGVPGDIGKIARVAYNRLYKDFACSGELFNCLEFDVTTNYGLMVAGGEKKPSGELTDAEMDDPDNLWSTHAYAGLPPTAINSPGLLALEGAVSPPPGEWLFFVAIDKEGNSAFAETADEHAENEQIARDNGIL